MLPSPPQLWQPAVMAAVGPRDMDPPIPERFPCPFPPQDLSGCLMLLLQDKLALMPQKCSLQCPVHLSFHSPIGAWARFWRGDSFSSLC